jgi:hypothetical protein
MIKEFEKENEVKIKIQKSLQQRIKTWNDPKDNKKEENEQHENVKVKLLEDHKGDKDINDDGKCSEEAFEDKGDKSKDADRDVNNLRGVPEDIAASKLNAEISRGVMTETLVIPKEMMIETSVILQPFQNTLQNLWKAWNTMRVMMIKTSVILKEMMIETSVIL